MTAEATLRGAMLKRIRDDYPRSKRQVLVFGRPAGPSTGPGHPDLFGVATGRFFALEIKVLKSKPTPLQVQRIKDLRDAGAYAWVVRTTTEASKAIYQAKIGGRMPSPTDPIDFDDWFKEITSQPAPEPEPTSIQAAADADQEAYLQANEPVTAGAAIEQAAVEAGIDVAAPVEEERDPANGVLPSEPSAQAVEEMPEVDNKDARRGRFAAPAVPAYEHIDGVLRTIGDRITETWEQGNRVETLSRVLLTKVNQLAEEAIAVRTVLNKILNEIDMGSETAPTVVEEPTPFDDVVPAIGTPVRRGRKRKEG